MGSMILICGVLILLAFTVWGLILATLLDIERQGRVLVEPGPTIGKSQMKTSAPPSRPPLVLSSPHH